MNRYWNPNESTSNMDQNWFTIRWIRIESFRSWIQIWFVHISTTHNKCESLEHAPSPAPRLREPPSPGQRWTRWRLRPCTCPSACEDPPPTASARWRSSSRRLPRPAPPSHPCPRRRRRGSAGPWWSSCGERVTVTGRTRTEYVNQSKVLNLQEIMIYNILYKRF